MAESVSLDPPDSTEAETACQTETGYWDWCPRCSHRLVNVKCKLVCLACGYFMSCSDFD
jgi:hypothetical protein